MRNARNDPPGRSWLTQPYNFNHFARGALEDPSRLQILIIDDVETIAWSRKRPDAEQYMIETVRITNLCLAGFDVLRAVPNALANATSSRDTMLDDGFLDRCSLTADLTLRKVPERYGRCFDASFKPARIAVASIAPPAYLPLCRFPGSHCRRNRRQQPRLPGSSSGESCRE
ncbi:hypothetical protein CDEST_09384 [Colletotrichum destructivum]|uniref:Uncharacterized protein n=1 Tax=Colletotrichum destructivum TaxID=34406 RepID=A0AAX4ILM1_9PEZI|nr:hypothetical protein CDEST_09384 [Colletotrichum destructivum]